MQLSSQRRLAAQILKCSAKRIRFDTDRLGEIKESITKADIKGLIKDKAIIKIPKKGVSRGRARIRLIQRRKGRQKGPGNREGSRGARLPRKREWIYKIRTQRKLLRYLVEKKIITKKTFRQLYMKSKGGFFRSRRHIKLYIKEHNLK